MTENTAPLSTEHLRMLRKEHQSILMVIENGFAGMRRQLERVERQIAGRKRDDGEIADDV